MIWASITLAVREIRRHLLRSFLTTLGIVIGVATVITMITLGNAVTAGVEEQISGLGANVIMVAPRQTSSGSWPPPIKPADAEAIRGQIAGVRYVSGQVSVPVTAIHDGRNWSTSINGTSNDYLEAQHWPVVAGRRFSAAEERSGAAVCVIGATVAEMLYDGDPVGQPLRLGSVPCTVIGAMKARGSNGFGANPDDVVLMPLPAVQRRFLGARTLHWIVLGIDPAYDNTAVAATITALMRERRHIALGEDEDFTIIDSRQISDTVTGATKALTALVAAIASISMVVGGIGIMNIMLVTVTERTREIGIRMAIGAVGREVRLQFIIEAVALCCLGGVVGMALAAALSFTVTHVMEVAYVFDPIVNALAVLAAATVGIVFGYVPARRAAALDPIDALRHE